MLLIRWGATWLIVLFSDSLWWARHLQADFICQLNSAFGLSGRVLRSAVWRVMFQRTHDSTFASPEPVGELQ